MEGNYNWDLGHKFLQQGQALQDTSPNGSHDPTAQKECKVWGRELQCRSIWKTPQAPRVTISLLRPQTIPWVSRPVNIGEKSSLGQGWWVNLHGILAQAELKAFTLPFCLAMTIYPHSEGNISQVVRNLASHLMWQKSLEYPACQQQRQMPIPDTSPSLGTLTDFPVVDSFCVAPPPTRTWHFIVHIPGMDLPPASVVVLSVLLFLYIPNTWYTPMASLIILLQSEDFLFLLWKKKGQ